jgi:hypothetical protein
MPLIRRLAAAKQLTAAAAYLELALLLQVHITDKSQDTREGPTELELMP